MNARPKKDDSEKMQTRKGFWCTETESNEIDRLASLHGYKNVAEFMRRSCLGYETVDRSLLNKED